MQAINSTKNSDRLLKIVLDDSIFRFFAPRDALMVYVLAVSGCTPSDLVLIRKSDLKGNFLFIPSAKKEVSFPAVKISKQAVSCFKRLSLTNKEFIFSGKKPLSVRRVEQIVLKAAKTVGSQLTSPRLLRKNYLKHLSSIENARLTSVSQRKILSPDNIDKIFSSKALPKRDLLMIKLLLASGIRVSELVALPFSAVKSDSIFINRQIAHDGISRTVSIPSALAKELLSLPKNIFLFSSSSGKQLSVRRFEQICKQIGNSVFIPLSPSILRATAIYLLSKKLPLEVVRRYAGLKSDIFYTHGLVASKSTHATSPYSAKQDTEKRKDDTDTYSAHSQYVRSRRRFGGGDLDE